MKSGCRSELIVDLAQAVNIIVYHPPDITCIRARADMAPANTVRRECLIDMIADMKKVLSPSSDTTITDNVAMNACIKPELPCKQKIYN